MSSQNSIAPPDVALCVPAAAEQDVLAHELADGAAPRHAQLHLLRGDLRVTHLHQWVSQFACLVHFLLKSCGNFNKLGNYFYTLPCLINSHCCLQESPGSHPLLESTVQGACGFQGQYQIVRLELKMSKSQVLPSTRNDGR